MKDRTRVRIPADIDRPDRVLAGLTARQLAILAIAAVLLWAAYAATRRVVPLPVFAALAVPVAGLATTLALGKIAGLPADRLLAAAWRHLRSPRRLVPAPEGVRPVSSSLGAGSSPLPSPLHLPFGGVSSDGVVDLGEDGLAVICRASSVTFALRSPAEQEALVAGFGRFLNSLSEPVQLLVRAEPVELSAMVAALNEAAPGLPHPALEQAAKAHASFLSELAARRSLLRREVLVVLRQRRGEGAAEQLARRAGESVSALAAAGVSLAVLGGEAAGACVVKALDPGRAEPPAGVASPTQVITRRRRSK